MSSENHTSFSLTGILRHHHQGLSDEDRRSRVKDDYAKFIEARAAVLSAAAQRACAGQPMELSELFDDGQ